MFDNIQLLRIFSAVCVALFHGKALVQMVDPAMPGIERLLYYGFAGVDVFFVISGFVAAHTTQGLTKGARNAWRYLARRALRIYLGYWPFFVLALLATATIDPAALAQQNLLTSFFLTFLYGLQDARTLVLFVTWSLGYELIFYALVSLSLMVSAGRLKLYALLAAVLVTALLLPQRDLASHWFIVALAFSCEFAFGIFARLLLECLDGRRALLLSLPAMLLGGWAGVHFKAELGPIRTFTFGVFSFGLVLFMASLEKFWHLKSPRLLANLGDASYAVYLFHATYLSLLGYWGWSSLLHSPNGFLRLLYLLGFFGFLLLACHLYHGRVESKIYRWAVRKVLT